MILGFLPSFGLMSATCYFHILRCYQHRTFSHEVKSTSQPKGWHTSLGLMSAKVIIFFCICKKIQLKIEFMIITRFQVSGK